MFAVLHIADFALHAVLRNEPETAGRPAALFDGTRKKSLVLAANAPARNAGVCLGMTAPQAVARCASLLIRTPEPEAESEAARVLLALAFTLSPSVEETEPGICTIALQGLDPLQHTPRALEAVAQLNLLGLPATAGLARTPRLALYAARVANPVFKISDEESFLAPLPLSTATPSAELAEVFAQWGLRTLGDLTALPRDEIIHRFGAEGLAFWNRATGDNSRPLKLATPPQDFSAKFEFEEPVETLEPLLFLLRRFLDRLTLELRVAQLVAVEIELALRLEDDTQYGRRFRLPEPTGEVEILFRTLHTHLESVQTASPIVALQLRLIPTRPLVRQQGLFETGLRDPHGFAETLARVVAIVGSDRIGTPQLEDSYRPDAVKLVPPLAVIPPAPDTAIHPPVGLPLRRFRPPLPVKLEFTGETPTYLWAEPFHGAIDTILGPWRSNGDWWQPDRAWARTEWDIVLTDGGLYRLIQINEAFFIEGEYD
ncbi:MAG: DNA polymerase Y family protein [Nibricoccus sp.]